MANEKPVRSDVATKEIERLGGLPEIKNLYPDEPGVLLSDKIKKYCGEDCRLIYPFELENLKPAGYDLRVGSHYAKGEQIFTLKEWAGFDIEPYSVAVIETLETLNIPEFLIGRWNIRVTLAYEGLLWVGGAQVDPGFRGRLSCPIYNLSAKKVSLTYGQPLAMIDFVTTTPFVEHKSLRFDWSKRKSLIFKEYVNGLSSGVAKQLELVEDSLSQVRRDQLSSVQSLKLDLESKQTLLRQEFDAKQTSHSEKADARFNYQGTRIDTFVTLIFTVVAVLFAGLGIIATKGNNDPTSFATPAILAAGALYLSLRAFVISQDRLDKKNPIDDKKASVLNRVFSTRPIEPLICLVFVFLGVAFYYYQTHSKWDDLNGQIKAYKCELDAQSAARQAEQERDTQFRKKTAEDLEALRKQLLIIKPAPAPAPVPGQSAQSR
jgi:deoxycytidine triphosphate deaminase